MALASTKKTLIGMLDPQSQMSINPTGTYQKSTSSGTTVTAKPANVSPGVTHASADVANPFAQAQYTMMERQLANSAAATGGGGGGGGNGYTAPPPIVQPPITEPPIVDPPVVREPEGPGSAGGDGTGDLLGQFTDQEITAAIAALEAQYGMTREQLLQDQTLIGSQYRLLMARLNRQRQMGAEAVTSDAVSRGIYRSGIHGENLLDVENQSMEQIRDAETQRLHSEQGIQTQLSYLDAQKAAESAQTSAALRREQGNYHLAAGVPMPSQWGGGGGGALGGMGGAPVPGGGASGMIDPKFSSQGYGVPPGGFGGGAPAGAPGAAGDGSNPYYNSQFNQQLQTYMGHGGGEAAGQKMNYQATDLNGPVLSQYSHASDDMMARMVAHVGRGGRGSDYAQYQLDSYGSPDREINNGESFLNRLNQHQLGTLSQQEIQQIQATTMRPEEYVSLLGRLNERIAAGR